MNFLDANVVLALLWERHMRSEQARRWFYQDAEGIFCYCRFTQVTVLRLLTTEAVLGNDTRSMTAAWRAWDRLAVDTRVAHIDEPTGVEMEFRALSDLPSRSPKVWADAYLLAFAKAAGLRLVTFDRSLRSGSANVLLL